MFSVPDNIVLLLLMASSLNRHDADALFVTSVLIFEGFLLIQSLSVGSTCHCNKPLNKFTLTCPDRNSAGYKQCSPWLCSLGQVPPPHAVKSNKWVELYACWDQYINLPFPTNRGLLHSTSRPLWLVKSVSAGLWRWLFHFCNDKLML